MTVLMTSPYESPIEELFAHNCQKYLEEDVEVIPQFPIESGVCRFRLDFVLQRGDERVAIECDGEEFHKGDDEWRDEFRDAIILTTGQVSRIYRFQGKDLHYQTERCISFLQAHEPQLFSARGTYNLERLVGEARALYDDRREQFGTIHSFPNELGLDKRSLKFLRIAREHVQPGSRVIYLKYANLHRENPDYSVEELMELQRDALRKSGWM